MILMQFQVSQLVIVPALNRMIIFMLCLLLDNNCGDRCLEIRQCSGGFQAEKFRAINRAFLMEALNLIFNSHYSTWYCSGGFGGFP